MYFCEISIKIGFPLFEIEAAIECLDVHCLLLPADQKRAGGAFGGAVLGVVRKFRCVEIAAELAVYAAKQVEVELGGHALRIVVGGDDHPRVLLHIEADEQAVVGVHHSAKAAEEIEGPLLLEIADIRTEKQKHLSPAVRVLKRTQHLEIIAGVRVDPQVRELRMKPLRQHVVRFLRDVDRGISKVDTFAQ